jgi:hypothetical protein
VADLANVEPVLQEMGEGTVREGKFHRCIS